MLSYPCAYCEEEIGEIINALNFLNATVCYLSTAKAKVYILEVGRICRIVDMSKHKFTS